VICYDLNMKLEMSQSLSQVHSQRMELRPELRLAMDQKLVQLMDTLEDVFPNGTKKEEILRVLLNKALESIKNEDLRNSLTGLIAGDQFTDLILKNLENLSSENPETVEDLALQYVYDMHSGRFEIKNKEGKIESTISDVNAVLFKKSYKDPEAINEEIEIEEAALEKVQEKSGLIGEISRYRQALNLVELMRQELSTVIDLVKFILNQKFGEKNENVLDFVNETALLGKFKLFESERLVKRFINRCDDVGVTHFPERHKEALLNTIGEFVLISFGVISPNVFVLKQGNIDDEMADSLKKFTEESGLDYDKLIKRFNLTKRGGYFYQRWATLGEKPSAITDQNVRDFITRTVRKDGDELLEAAKFMDIIEEIKDIKRGTDEPVERMEKFHDIFDNLFSDHDFIAVLLKKAGGWHKELRAFYPKNS
jgi:hypothetical protein